MTEASANPTRPHWSKHTGQCSKLSLDGSSLTASLDFRQVTMTRFILTLPSYSTRAGWEDREDRWAHGMNAEGGRWTRWRSLPVMES